VHHPHRPHRPSPADGGCGCSRTARSRACRLLSMRALFTTLTSAVAPPLPADRRCGPRRRQDWPEGAPR
jgi:hypothetical protein